MTCALPELDRNVVKTWLYMSTKSMVNGWSTAEV